MPSGEIIVIINFIQQEYNYMYKNTISKDSFWVLVRSTEPVYMYAVDSCQATVWLLHVLCKNYSRGEL